MTDTGSPSRSGWAAPDGRDIEDLVGDLEPLLEMIQSSPLSLTSVRTGTEARDIHLRDSLSGLAAEPLLEAGDVLDLGSGAGFPGLPLAMALPATRFTLIDSVTRKAEFIESAAEALGIRNVTALPVRSEEVSAGPGREGFDCVTARAVAPLSALAELASPLLREGGSLVAWKGERESGEEEILEGLEDRIAMRVSDVIGVVPFEGSRTRNLYLVTKTGPTPTDLPRRAGMARKRPLSA